MKEEPDDHRAGEAEPSPSLKEVLLAGELECRPTRAPVYAGENEALGALAVVMAENPERTLQMLVERALTLCRAGSAGISILETPPDGPEVFRWPAVAGAWAPHAWGTMSRHASVCGVAIEHDRVLLFDRPGRVFSAVRDLQPPAHEMLIGSFRVGGRSLGTLWAISHHPERRFDAEDARLLASLARFATAAYVHVASRRTETERRQAALNLMEDAVLAQRETEGANAALRTSEERRRIALEAGGLATWEWHLPTDEVFWNEEHFRLLGLEPRPNPVRPDDFFSRVLAEDQSDLRQRLQRTIEDGRLFEAEFRIHRKDDHALRWMHGFGRVTEASSGHTVRISGVMRDITAARSVSEALRESEERFRQFADASADVLWIVDAETRRLEYLSPAFARVWGEPPEAVLRDLGRWAEQLHPADHDRVKGALDHLLAGSTHTIEYRIVRPDGELRWIRDTGFPIRDAAGRVRRAAGIAQDITEERQAGESLRRSEETLRLTIENAREHAIFSTDLNSLVTSWNVGAERVLGYAESEIVGQSADQIFTPEDRAAGAPERERETALREGRAGDDRWHQRRDGSRFWASGVMLPMRPAGEGSEPLGFVKILRDETERRLARESLEDALRETERARAEAEAAAQAKDHFLAVLSHELRTPLTPVLMTARVLARSKDLPPALAEGLETISRNVRLEARLIDDLLDLTRIARGKLEILRAPMDLHEAVQRAVEVCEANFQNKNQRLELSLKAAEHRMEGDFGRLQQVFWNLLNNASKFTPEGGVIRLSSRASTQEGHIALEVTDTGIGITEEALGRIFNPFEQADASVTRRFGGLGLGLAISQAVIEVHGGSLEADSGGPGQGAVFTVCLPLLEEPPAP